MKKYILALLAAFGFAHFGFSANVAKIDDVEYPTLAEAIAAVPIDGTETAITLIAAEEATDVVSILATQKIKLDLNGQSYSCSATTENAIVNTGTLTIQDSAGNGKLSGLTNLGIATLTGGTIAKLKNRSDHVVAYSELTISGTAVVSGIIQNYNYANITITGGQIKQVDTVGPAAEMGTLTAIGESVSFSLSTGLNSFKGTIIFDRINWLAGFDAGCKKFVATESTFNGDVSVGGAKRVFELTNCMVHGQVKNYGTLTIDGGTYNGKITNSSGLLTIKGNPTVTAATGQMYALSNESSGNMIIESGTFTAEEGYQTLRCIAGKVFLPNETVVINGWKATQNADGTWGAPEGGDSTQTVRFETSASSSNTQKYTTFEEVMAKAASSKTVTIRLLADFTATETATIAANQNVTLDLNGYTVTAAAPLFTVEGTLTITDNAVKSSGAILGTGPIITVAGGSVTQTAGTLAMGTADAPETLTSETAVVDVVSGTYTPNGGAIVAHTTGAAVRGVKTAVPLTFGQAFTIIVPKDDVSTAIATTDAQITILGGTYTKVGTAETDPFAIRWGTFDVRPADAYLMADCAVTSNEANQYVVAPTNGNVTITDGDGVITDYTTFEEALAALYSFETPSACTVKLNCDVALKSVIILNTAAPGVIDLNGFTIDIQMVSSPLVTIDLENSFTLKNGEIRGYAYGSGSINPVINVVRGTDVVFENLKVTNTNSGKNAVYVDQVKNFKASGCIFESVETVLRLESPETAVIENTTLNKGSKAGYVNSALYINNAGRVSVSQCDLVAQAGSALCIAQNSAADISISGDQTNVSGMIYKSGTPPATLTITGGTYSTDVSEYVPEGSGVVENTDGSVSVVSQVAKIDGEPVQYFATLAEAIAAAGEGGTVTLLADVVLASTLSIDKSLTLDLGDNTLATQVADVSTVPTIKVQNDVTFTLQNGTVKGNSPGGDQAHGGGAAVETAGANCSIVLDDVTLIGGDSVGGWLGSALKVSHSAAITINNSTLKGGTNTATEGEIKGGFGNAIEVNSTVADAVSVTMTGANTLWASALAAPYDASADGSDYSKSATGWVVYNNGNKSSDTHALVKITASGTIHVTGGLLHNVDISTDSKVVLTASEPGAISQNLDFVVNSRHAIDEEGTSVIVEGYINETNAAAKIGETTYYRTFIGAANAATEGQTITLLKTETVSSSYTLQKDVQIEDANGPIPDNAMPGIVASVANSNSGTTTYYPMFAEAAHVLGSAYYFTTLTLLDHCTVEGDIKLSDSFSTQSDPVVTINKNGKTLTMGDSIFYCGAVNTNGSTDKNKAPVMVETESCLYIALTKGLPSVFKKDLIGDVNVVLNGNAALATSAVLSGENVTIDLNGYKISNADSSGWFPSAPAISLFTVGESNLTIIDSSDKKSGSMAVYVTVGSFPSVSLDYKENPQLADFFSGITEGTGSVALQGGTYTVDPTEYVATGYEAIANDTTPATWTVAEKITNWIQVADTAWYDTPAEGVDGSATAPYVITTAEQLAGLAKLVNAGTDFAGKVITLANEEAIDLDKYEWTPIGNVWGKFFQGTFNGQNKTISNLTVNTPNNSYVGMFGLVFSATITDVVLEKPNVVGKTSVAAIVGYGQGDNTFKNITVSSLKVSGTNFVGGFVGRMDNSTGSDTVIISNCHLKGSETAVNQITALGFYVGGFIAYCAAAEKTSITECTTEFTTIKETSGYAGGIIGHPYSTNLEVKDCFVSDLIIDAPGQYGYVGGVAGYVYQSPAIFENNTITNIKINATGNAAAGIMARNQGNKKLSIRNCHIGGEVQIKSAGYTSGIASRIEYYGNAIENCSVVGAEGSDSVIDGGANGGYVGGIYGWHPEGNFNKPFVLNDCKVQNITIKAGQKIGGIGGMLHYGNLATNLTLKNVTIVGQGTTPSVGLLFGENNAQSEATKINAVYNYTIENCSANGIKGPISSIAFGPKESSGGTFACAAPTFDDAGKVTGGTFEVFDKEIAAKTILAPAALWKANADGTYTVYMSEAKVGETYYATLQEAINVAVAADATDRTVVLQQDITDDVRIEYIEMVRLMTLTAEEEETTKPALTLDMNGYDINATVTIPADVAVELALENSKPTGGTIDRLIVETVEATVTKTDAVEVTNPPSGSTWEVTEEGSTTQTLTTNYLSVTLTSNLADAALSLNGGGTTFVPDSETTLIATANDGYVFVGWSGDVVSATNLTISVTGHLNAVANFIPSALYSEYEKKVVADYTVGVAMGDINIAVVDGETVTVGIQLQKASSLEGTPTWTTILSDDLAEVPTIDTTTGAIQLTLPIPTDENGNKEKKAFFKFIPKNDA